MNSISLVLRICLCLLTALEAAQKKVSFEVTENQPVDFGSPASILEHIRTISSPKHHKPFFKQVLQSAVALDQPHLIDRFFQLHPDHHAYAYQADLLAALERSVELGRPEVCQAILDVDKSQFNNQLILTSDRINLAVRAAVIGESCVLTHLLDSLVGQDGTEALRRITQTQQYKDSVMLQVIVANKQLMLELEQLRS